MSTGDHVYWTNNTNTITLPSNPTIGTTVSVPSGQTLTIDGSSTNYTWIQQEYVDVMQELTMMVKEKYDIEDNREAAEWIFDKLDAIHQMKESAVQQMDKITNGKD